MTPKLLDDCFLHDRDRLRHDEAIALLRARIMPVTAVETVPLGNAAGRILATPARAVRPVPAHTNAAVDGYAFDVATAPRAADGSFALPIEGRAAAGHPLTHPAAPGTAVRIFTGAVLPAGTDTVVMQEDTTLVETAGEDAGAEDAAGQRVVRIPSGVRAGRNIRRAGEDLKAGETLLEAGDRLRPQDLAALASVGLAEVACFARLRVAVVSTGDEVIRVGSRPLGDGEVYDANAPMLTALAVATGAEVVDLGVWPDDAGIVHAELARAAQSYDVILTSGGASRGEEDHMVRALDMLGRRHMWQLAIKPGRPMSFGQIGDCVVAGLPGNPVAVFVCFLMYVAPMLGRLGGGPWREPRRIPAQATFAVPDRKTGRREFWRGMLRQDGTGLAVDKFERDGSGLITSLRQANCLIDVAEDVTGVGVGDTVQVIPFTEFGIV